MKKILISFILIVKLTNINAQEATKFGLNCIYDDSSFNLMLAPKNSKIVDITKNYHIQFLRFPGGTVSRSYFWDRQDLIPKALQLYSDFLSTNIKANTDLDKNSKKVEYYNNKSDDIGEAMLGDSLYSDFLKFCKKDAIIPIIVLNSWYYHDKNTVYKILNEDRSTIDKNKWDPILTNLKKQAIFTHKYVNQVYWEIGNEDPHVYPANSYANIASKFAAVLKSLYPNDKIIIQYANPESKKVDNEWNNDMVACLEKSKSIQFIDFVAPHYYRGFEDEINSQPDLQKRIQKVDIFSKWQNLQSPLSNYPNIKLFYTEFGIFKKIVHPNYNTQMHTLFMLYYLMNFNATPNVYGVIQHSFTAKTTGIFFDENNFRNLNYGFIPTDVSPNSFFRYIPPQAKAIKLFYTYNSIKAQSLTVNAEYAFTITNDGDKKLINILNFSDHAVSINLSTIVNYSAGSKLNVVKYAFEDLNSHQWNYPTNLSPVAATSGTIQVSRSSYNVITIQK